MHDHEHDLDPVVACIGSYLAGCDFSGHGVTPGDELLPGDLVHPVRSKSGREVKSYDGETVVPAFGAAKLADCTLSLYERRSVVCEERRGWGLAAYLPSFLQQLG